MNERILEIAKQAGIKYSSEKALSPAEIKFAELIVKECIAKYNEWAEHSTDKTSFAMAQHNVKKHFGVEE